MILLVDMDAFFASVEQAHHPHLRGKPVIVCGDPSRRGVVTAASYEARPFGVRAGMPLAEARRLCPKAEYVEGSPRKYVEKSLELLEIFLSYTPDVEPFSVDEAFLDLSKLGARGATREAAIAMAREIQQRIADEHGLGASIGIGPNKLIAKMASGVHKPRGLTPMSEEEFRGVFWPQDVQALWGVGPKMSEHLKRLGLATVGDLARASEPMLEQAFGVVGVHLKHAAWGRDQTPVVPYHEGVDPKSMGHEVTLADDSRDEAFLEGTLLRLCDQVARRLRGEGFTARTVTLKLRDFRFRTITRQKALARGADDHLALYEVVRQLWRANWKGEPLRLVGVSASALEHKGEGEQGELFASDDRRKSLQEALDKVRDKLGEASVVPAGSLTHRRQAGHVPFGAMKRKDADAPGALSREGTAAQVKRKLRDENRKGP
ncbi:MAG: DNA polymerase IV [Candidatus Eisenbacteria bacterium]